MKRFTSALFLDDVVIGGGNAKKLKQAPPGCRLGTNANAFTGGFRLWEKAATDRKAGASRQPVDLDTTEETGAKA